MDYWKSKIELVLQISFWVLLLVASISLTSQVFPVRTAIYMGLSNLALWMTLAYINIGILYPFLFKRRRLFLYFLSFIALAFITVPLREFINNSLFDFRPIEVINNLPPINGRKPLPFLRFIPVSLFSLVILFASTIFKLAKEFLEKESESAQLKNEKITHELHFLRSQINPHFLFNALNNLHATVQLRPEKAGNYILKLGDMLRYVLEDCIKEQVSLADEIKYIENYIYFQKQKDEHIRNVRFEQKVDDTSTTYLEPMLFIPLVENAFKHNYLKETTNQWINIQLTTPNDKIQLTVTNNLGATPHDNKEGFGVGLSNIRRRLELKYPGRHQLVAERRTDHFFASLTISGWK